MSKIDQFIANVKTQQIAQTGKQVLLVEGEDDVHVFSAFLTKKSTNWEQHWVVIAAHGKSKVIEILGKEPGWLGIIDRDEWTDADVQQASQQNVNLFVLPRFCIESYLIVPDEIWAALPEVQRLKMPNRQADLNAAINRSLEAWTRHAALWHVVNPLYQRMRRPDHRGTILDDPQDVPNRQVLEQILQAWLDGLDPIQIANSVDELEQQYLALAHHELFTKHLYAKKFYPMVVHQALNQLLGQKSEDVRMKALLRTLPLPADLEPLWGRMGI
ncbi:DUF3226 domain-containing protein [Aeromonas caviae]|uniref:DUF3226 domain-containing protein n=1 Tax=Aeromonas caviae TaxID=648 RepID=UPI0029D6D0E3|nr:DUF3226 domain-containing protein [Aeromonas caviae]MDX7713115.1 DUF4435 domain-containing protein [Aeromonas caviae]